MQQQLKGIDLRGKPRCKKRGSQEEKSQMFHVYISVYLYICISYSYHMYIISMSISYLLLFVVLFLMKSCNTELVGLYIELKMFPSLFWMQFSVKYELCHPLCKWLCLDDLLLDRVKTARGFQALANKGWRIGNHPTTPFKNYCQRQHGPKISVLYCTNLWNVQSTKRMELPGDFAKNELTRLGIFIKSMCKKTNEN